MKKIIFTICLVFAANIFAVGGDVNSDGVVDPLDLRIFADEWLTTGTLCDFIDDDIVNFLDFAFMAENWSGGLITPNTPPIVADKAVDANTFEIKAITLTATDADQTASWIQYYITRNCQDSDAYLQDPASSVGKILKTPHRLRNRGSEVWLSADAVETLTFKWKAFDGTDFSGEANCVVTVKANPKKQLSFDGSGYVTVADNDNLELVNKRGIALYVKTRSPKGTLVSKYTSGSAGYVFSLVNGKPTLRLYSSSGLVSTVTGTRRVDDGLWNHIGFAYDANGYVEIDINNETVGVYKDFDIEGTAWTEVSAIDYTNSAAFIVGENFKGEIDNVRSYLFTNLTGEGNYEFRGYVSQTRADAGTLDYWGGFTMCPAATIRFHCDYDGVNNTDSQIYDDFANHYTGSISSSAHCKYEPFNNFWMDLNILRWFR